MLEKKSMTSVHAGDAGRNEPRSKAASVSESPNP